MNILSNILNPSRSPVVAAFTGFDKIKEGALIVVGIICVFGFVYGVIQVLEGITKIKNGEQGWLAILGGVGLVLAPFIVYGAYSHFMPAAALDLGKLSELMSSGGQ